MTTQQAPDIETLLAFIADLERAERIIESYQGGYEVEADVARALVTLMTPYIGGHPQK